jgi:hypothetical protein
VLQLVPFHVQVSPSVWLPDVEKPPNRTQRPRFWSNAIAALVRALGCTSGARRFHVVPFHSHVSPPSPMAVTPPNSTTTWRALSHAKAPNGGGEPVAVVAVQFTWAAAAVASVVAAKKRSSRGAGITEAG